jgi:hypothetical protein
VAAAGEAAGVLAYGHADQRPLAEPVGLHRHVDHDPRHLVRLDRDPPVQQVFEDQQLVGALFEAAEVERAGAERHRPGIDRGDPPHGQEDPAAQRHLRDKPDHLGWAVGGAQPDHRVPHPADLVAVRVEHGKPGQPGDVHPGRRGHPLSVVP